jgi:opacity protein-like surface antigen
MTKRIMLVSAALFILVAAEAQIERGRILASGSLGFNFSNYRDIEDGVTESDSKSTDFWLMPRGGIFITDAILVGAGIGLSSGTTRYDEYKSAYTSISFIPFVRYYLPQNIFGQIEVGPGISTDRWSYDGEEEDKDSYTFFRWSIGAGYSYFLNDNVAIEPIISYTSTNYTDRNNTAQKDKYGDLLFQIGLSIYLDCQKLDL